MSSIENNVSATIDRAQLLERCLGIDAFADKLANAFIATLPSERSNIRAAFESSDMALVAKQAHRLRGSASNLCANQLSAAAEAVETAAKNQLDDSITNLIHEVESAIDRLLDEYGGGITSS